MLKKTKWVVLLLLILSSTHFATIIEDPEDEVHFKVFFGYFNSKIIIGYERHIPLSIDEENPNHFKVTPYPFIQSPLNLNIEARILEPCTQQKDLISQLHSAPLITQVIRFN